MIKKIILSLFIVALSALAACTQSHTIGTAQTQTPTAPATQPETVIVEPTEPFVPSVQTELEITELMARNTVGVTASDGKRYGWVELHNITDKSVSLSGYSLYYNGTEWLLPKKDLGAGEYIYFFTSGNVGDGNIPFTLKTNGLLVLRRGGADVCRVYYNNPTSDYSYIVGEKAETVKATPGYETALEKDGLIISEIMRNNETYPIRGYLRDWVEIYNPGEKEISLGSFFLSNSENNCFSSRLPDVTLKGGEYYVVVCGGVDVGFSLSSSEKIILTRCDGVSEDSLDIKEADNNCSLLHDGSVCKKPTPGYPDGDEYNKLIAALPKGLIINEVISSNTKYAKAGDGKYYDVIELYNNSGETVRLSDYYLSDKKTSLAKWRLPDITLAAGKYYIVYAAGITSASYPSFASFSVSSKGESIYLSENGTYISDVVVLPEIPVNCSYGRTTDGLAYFASPTPGAVNGKSSIIGISSGVTASVKPGKYENAVSLTLSTSDGGSIYYTLDGTTPSKSSTKYTGNNITVSKNTVIKAINFCDNKLSGSIVSFAYLIAERDYTLDILNISLNPSQFNTLYANKTGEYQASAILMSPGGNELFSVNCGLKISGRSSTAYAKKSFLLKFRSEYDMANLEYKVFENSDITEFDTLVVRSGSYGNVNYRMIFNDEFMSSVIMSSANIDLLVQNYRPVDLYINGEYYGVYFIREKINSDFVASHEGGDKESSTVLNFESYLGTSIDLYDGNQSDLNEFKALWSFATTKDLTVKSNYDYVAERIDLKTVADFYIMTVWCHNLDTTNLRIYKSNADNGIWKVLMFDADYSFPTYYGYTDIGEYGAKAVTSLLKNGMMSDYTEFLKNLLKTDEFKKLFFGRLKTLVETDLATEHITAVFDGIIDTLKHDMEYNIERWAGYKLESGSSERYHNSMDEWLSKTEIIRKNYICDKHIETIVGEFISVVGLTESEVRDYMGDSYVKYCK